MSQPAPAQPASSAQPAPAQPTPSAAAPAAAGAAPRKKDKKKDKDDKAPAKLTEKQLKKQERVAQAAAQQAAAAEKKDKKPKKKPGAAATEERKIAPIPAPGQMKDFINYPIAPTYVPHEVEPSWDAWWEAQGIYKADNTDTKSEKFVMVIPPPNVTGTLHLGHALTCSIEDTVIRWNRMCGKNVLWVPGTDHAGIATQVVVEKKLMREKNQTRHDLGRDAFIQEVHKWKNSNGDRIYSQIRRMGASVDWTRETFTMDEQRSRAVTEAFVRLHKDGLIYRAARLVSWSCTLRTAISNIEVNKIEIDNPPMMRKVPGYAKPIEFGVLHKFAYKVKKNDPNEPDQEIVVATTRLETMLGDVAVAVNSKDPRYTNLIGRKLVHPFLPERDLIVLADDILVDMNFGTGAVKVTPAHSPDDYACAVRYNLPFINIFTDDGLINQNGGAQFAGKKRFDVREELIVELTKMGHFRGKELNKMSIGICSRSNDIVEPVIRPQWWVRCKSMADAAIKKAEDGELEFTPARYKQEWFRWLSGIQDWCISRQLWWGHRIPAWNVSIKGVQSNPEEKGYDDKYWIVARTEQDAWKIAEERFKEHKREDIKLSQDDDVLDTWFSSGLFPFSTMGWPDKTPDVDAFYPGHLLETGHDILFFWVARMVMMGLQLTGKLPFKKVFLHAMVRDKFGRKMSKSLGNIIDPIDVMDGISLDDLQAKLRTSNLEEKELIKALEGQRLDFPKGIDECGADALRFGLLAYSTNTTSDINLDVQRVVAYRQFGNKLWNAVKFGLIQFPKDYKPVNIAEATRLVSQAGSTADKWMLHRLLTAATTVEQCFQNYDFAALTDCLYKFWLYEICDVYLELVKPIAKSTDAKDAAKKDAALATLYITLDLGLRLMHPLMPFITEELYHRLPGAAFPPNYAAAVASASTASAVAAEQDVKSGAPQLSIRQQAERKITGARATSGSISVQPYPRPAMLASWKDDASDAACALVQKVGVAVRSQRSAMGIIVKSTKTNLFIVASDAKEAAILENHKQDLAILAFCGTITVLTKQDNTIPTGAVGSDASASIKIFIPPVEGATPAKPVTEKPVDKATDKAAKAAQNAAIKAKYAAEKEAKAKAAAASSATPAAASSATDATPAAAQK